MDTEEVLKNILGTEDYKRGFRAGVEWAEEYGDCSLIKFFVDSSKEAEDSYKK